ncbi:MAG: hypothetical protein KJ767_03020 [Nanoarchaeota archaeon]|nr:hypothetical protein [Nanoarchaeota archaeon]
MAKTRANRNTGIKWEFISAFAAFFIVLMIGLSVNPSFTGLATYSGSYSSCSEIIDATSSTFSTQSLTNGACIIQNDKIVKVSEMNYISRTAKIHFYEKYSLVAEERKSNYEVMQHDDFKATIYVYRASEKHPYFPWSIYTPKAYVNIEFPKTPIPTSQNPSTINVLCNNIRNMLSTKTSEAFTDVFPGDCITYKDYLILKTGEFASRGGTILGEGIYLELWKKQSDGKYGYVKPLMYKKVGTSVVRLPASGILEYEGLNVEPKLRELIVGYNKVFDLVVSYDVTKSVPGITGEEQGISVEHPLEACRYDYDADGKVAVADISALAQNIGKTGNTCKLGTRTLRCTVFDGNRDGVINNDDLPNAFIGKECPISNFDYGDGNGKIESTISGNNDGYFWDQRYKQGAPNYERDCVGGIFTLAVRESKDVGSKTLNLIEVGSQGDINVDVDGDEEIIGSGSIKTVGGLIVKNVARTYSTIQSSTATIMADNNCLNYDLDADYKLTINDLYMLQKYDGKVLVQAPPLPPTPTCTDSDNGIEYGVNGYVRYSNIYYNDVCSRDYLREYYCNSGVVASDYHACENGCEYGICKSAPTCVENDGGRTYNTKGMVTGTDASGAWKTVTDYCSSSSVLKEYYCATTGSRYSYILHDCIAHGFAGCSNGICITSGTTTGCTDTDAGTGDGINYNEKGTVTNPDGEDSCYSGKWLREYYCQTDGTSTSKAYVCPGSCSNGKCV